MKIGVHASEPLDEIIARKLKEIDEAGYALWGYGGNTCHPTSMVQPFGHSMAQDGQPIFLCMNKMVSHHYAERVRATHCSTDGIHWEEIPHAVNAVGSRYALKITNLRHDAFLLPLTKAHVAIGPSEGMPAARYVGGRVDKACLRLQHGADVPLAQDEPAVEINLVAELAAPYAVFLKNVTN